MAINLIEGVQKKLNVEALQKIDPDTGDVKDVELVNNSNKFYQLAIPAVLTGLYRFTRTAENNMDILNMSSGDLLSALFGDHADNVVEKISELTGIGSAETRDKLETTAEASVGILKENLNEKPSNEDVASSLTRQRHNILLYLPTSLQLGHHLHDETVDDSTNKMEGPVSDFMHNIGQIFSGPGSDGKENV